MMENSQREATKMPSATSIQNEMVSALDLLGGNGSAKERVRKASRATGLTPDQVNRLRWRKVKTIPAHIADTIRAAVENHNARGLARAEHEIAIAQHRAAIMAARLAAIDPDFFGAEIDGLRRQSASLGLSSDREGQTR